MFKTKKTITIGLSSAMTAKAHLLCLEVKETMRNIIDKNEILDSYDKLISPTSLSLGNNEILLYVTFNSQKNSLMKFKNEISTKPDLIKSTFQLDDINEKNYMNCFSHVMTLTDSNVIGSERGNEMQEFFDKYENKYQNDKKRKSLRSNAEMPNSTSKTSTWYFQSSNNYLYSWTVANTFSKYMGRTRYNVTWNTFKSKLVKGSFIGKDNTDDGDLNHMAFITDIKSDKSQVQIAQHTDNYLKWSDISGWINIGSKAVYYLVR